MKSEDFLSFGERARIGVRSGIGIVVNVHIGLGVGDCVVANPSLGASSHLIAKERNGKLVAKK
jgi:hypothetical protein